MAKLEPFAKRFYTATLGGSLSPYGNIMDKKVTPAMVVMATNNRLPSFQRGAQHSRAIGLEYTLNPLNALRGYTFIDWIGGFGIIPLLNVIQLGLTSGLEIGFRAAGLLLTRPTNIFLNWIILDVNNEKSITEKIFAGAGAVLLSPFWCIGQALTLVADVFSYTRSLLDSAMYLVNPLWWMSVAGILPDDKTPSFRVVAKTFFTSLLQLVPAAFIIAAAAITGGASLPVTHAISGPLAALGPTITTAFTAAWATITAHTFTGIFVAGAIAVAAKFISASIGEISRRLTDDNKNEFAEKAKPAPKQKKVHHSNLDIAEQAHYTPIKDPRASVSIDRPSVNSTDEQRPRFNTKILPDDEPDDRERESEGRRPSAHR